MDNCMQPSEYVMLSTVTAASQNPWQDTAKWPYFFSPRHCTQNQQQFSYTGASPQAGEQCLQTQLAATPMRCCYLNITGISSQNRSVQDIPSFISVSGIQAALSTYKPQLIPSQHMSRKYLSLSFINAVFIAFSINIQMLWKQNSRFPDIQTLFFSATCSNMSEESARSRARPRKKEESWIIHITPSGQRATSVIMGL